MCAKQYVAWKSDLARKERKCGGTSASRDENAQVDVWHKLKDRFPSKELREFRYR